MSLYLYNQPQVLSLLRAAKEQPEDDTPRLVLADWLEDHGDPDRAEFIHLQLRLSRNVTLDAERKAMQTREQELLNRNGGAWLGPLWRFWLSPVIWHRGLLSVGLSRRISPESISDALPWIDTLLFQISGRQSLEHVGAILAQTSLNHLGLDLRVAQRESRLLSLLASLPEDPCLRTLSFDWPLGMLQRLETVQVQSSTVPTVSNTFLSRLLQELPLTRHLTHLASFPAWTSEQSALIRSLDIEPINKDQKLWMHAMPAMGFVADPATQS